MASASFLAIDLGRMGAEIVARPMNSRLARPRKGMNLVFFVRAYSDIQFVAKGRVESVSEDSERVAARGGPLPPEDGMEQAQVCDFVEYPQPRSLRRLAASLSRVKYLFEPDRHFRHRIVAFYSDDDFRTIDDNRIAPFRTAFRSLFEALPYPVRADFVRLNERHFLPLYEPIVKSYKHLAPLLVEYIEERLLPFLEITGFIGDRYKAIRADEKPPITQLRLESPHKSGDGARSPNTPIPIGQAAHLINRELDQICIGESHQHLRGILQFVKDELLSQEAEKTEWKDTIL